MTPLVYFLSIWAFCSVLVYFLWYRSDGEYDLDIDLKEPRSGMNPLLKLDVLQVRKGDEKAIEVLEVNEQNILLAEARKYAQEHDPRWFMRPFLGLHIGARSGEIAGLQWGDINWEQRTLNINKAVHYDFCLPSK